MGSETSPWGLFWPSQGKTSAHMHMLFPLAGSPPPFLPPPPQPAGSPLSVLQTIKSAVPAALVPRPPMRHAAFAPRPAPARPRWSLAAFAWGWDRDSSPPLGPGRLPSLVLSQDQGRKASGGGRKPVSITKHRVHPVRSGPGGRKVLSCGSSILRPVGPTFLSPPVHRPPSSATGRKRTEGAHGLTEGFREKSWELGSREKGRAAGRGGSGRPR